MKPDATSFANPSRRCLIALLIALVLFAQWMGMRHRIAHANWAGAAPALAQAASQQQDSAAGEYEGDKSHSCALFDHATLAHAAPAIVFTLPLQTGAKVLALWLAFTSWDAPHICFFSSRAPPSA